MRQLRSVVIVASIILYGLGLRPCLNRGRHYLRRSYRKIIIIIIKAIIIIINTDAAVNRQNGFSDYIF